MYTISTSAIIIQLQFLSGRQTNFRLLPYLFDNSVTVGLDFPSHCWEIVPFPVWGFNNSRLLELWGDLPSNKKSPKNLISVGDQHFWPTMGIRKVYSKVMNQTKVIFTKITIPDGNGNGSIKDHINQISPSFQFDSIYCIYVVGLFYVWSIQNADDIIETHISK